MKALVISDRSEIIDFVTPLLKDKGYDLIHYKWIIKALDNIEEIQPDIIVLSANEYPRHWKTLAGFVQSGIGGNDVRMYLYDTEPLSTEEAGKANDLKVLSFEDEFSGRRTVDVEIVVNEPGKMNMKFYTGTYYPDDDYVEVDSDSALAKDSMFTDSFVKYVSISDGSEISSFSADAKKEDDEHVYLYVKDYYEKKI